MGDWVKLKGSRSERIRTDKRDHSYISNQILARVNLLKIRYTLAGHNIRKII